MKTVTLKQSLVIFLAVAVIWSVVPATVGAEEADIKQGQTTTTDNSSTVTARRKEAAARAKVLREQQKKRREEGRSKLAEAKTQLEDGKLRACKNREKSINNIMSRMSDRGKKRLEVFDKIADRVKAFYDDKGLKVDNYDELVAVVDNTRADAAAATDLVTQDSVTFKCDGTDPKGASSVFQDSLKTQIKTLKAYRTAIKDLIVAVKNATGDEATASQENQ